MAAFAILCWLLSLSVGFLNTAFGLIGKIFSGWNKYTIQAIPAKNKAPPYFERENVNAFLEKLTAKLPSDEFDAVKARGEQLTPQEVYERYFGDG